MVVVLPTPDGPSTVTKSPARGSEEGRGRFIGCVTRSGLARRGVQQLGECEWLATGIRTSLDRNLAR